MIKTIILTLVIVVVLFELIEHVFFPLFWSIMGRKKKSACGVTGMLGKVGEVKQWKKNEGKVFVNPGVGTEDYDHDFSVSEGYLNLTIQL